MSPAPERQTARMIRGDDGHELEVVLVDTHLVELDGDRIWVAWPPILFDVARGDRLVCDGLPAGVRVVFAPEDVAL